jgi:hypothetical protein
MFTADVRFEGWTTDDWSRFLHLWKPRASADAEPTRPRGGVLVVHAGSRVRKVLHTRRGRVNLATVPWPMPLGDLAKMTQASWGLSIQQGALEELTERLGARIRRGDDAISQALCIVQIVREMMAEGVLEAWPHRLRGVPQPTEAMVRRAMDALCHDGRAIGLGMFKDGDLWTAFVARRRGQGFDVIAGPEELRRSMGVLSGDWRRDYRHLVRAIEERYAPLSFGCFAEVETFRALQLDARPGAWSRAIATRDVAVSPMSMAVGMAISIDGVRYVLGNVGSITKRLDPFGVVDPVLRTLRSKASSATGNKDVSVVLGFDPMAVLRALLTR